VFKFLPILTWSRQILVFLLLGAFATAGAFVLQFRGKKSQTPVPGPTPGRGQAIYLSPLLPLPANNRQGSPTMLRRSQLAFARIYEWWMDLRADPARCGLVVLVVWQIVPVLLLSRHTALIHQ